MGALFIDSHVYGRLKMGTSSFSRRGKCSSASLCVPVVQGCFLLHAPDTPTDVVTKSRLPKIRSKWWRGYCDTILVDWIEPQADIFSALQTFVVEVFQM